MQPSDILGILGVPVIFFIIVLLIVNLILWTFLPFAVFGIKAKLDKIIKELEKANTRKDLQHYHLAKP